MTKIPEAILYKYWGHSEFRGSQEQIIAAVLKGADVLALLPTGGGKSVCYQVPALAREGLCIVVSPLIALIQDQVSRLQSKGIKAIALTGGVSFETVSNLLDNAVYGNYKFLYLSPERLQQEYIQDRISQMSVNLIAIDEVHCISQWGNDFRPAYRNCGILRELQPAAPIIALTATATKRVTEDILENLNLRQLEVFKDSFSRPNIAYSVLIEEDKRYRLRQLCSSSKRSGIVYVRNRKSAEELSAFLTAQGISAAFYHGGVSSDQKSLKLKQWLANEKKIMVATNAFGMGVDKADVSLVIHYQIPDSIENYFQESGRAGRDGNLAQAIIITNANDEIQLKNQFIKVLPDVPFIKLLYRKLNNYFQIPYGSSSAETLQFRFNEFCDHYGFNTIMAYNALRILDQNSVVSLSQNFSRNAKLRFITSKHQLFEYLEKHPKIASTLQLLLRTYGGVFDFDTKINTYLLSKKTKLSEQELHLILVQLQKDGIIDYQAKHSDLELTFLVPREDDRTINAIATNVGHYLRTKKNNVEGMLSYLHNIKQCRNSQLLGYFGESTELACGLCDICQTKNNPKKIAYQDIQNAILNLLKEESKSSKTLIEEMPFEAAGILEAIQLLLEDRKIEVNALNQYKLN